MLMLTTKKYIDDILSDEGVEGRMDDDETGAITTDDIARINRFISRASLEVGMSLRARYKDSEWQGSNPPTGTPDSVQYMTAIIAARGIFERRGLPSYEGLTRQFEMVQQWLADIKAGNLSLVGVRIFPTIDFEPFVTSFTIDGRHRHAKVRAIETTSTGGASRRTHLENRYFVIWD